MEKAWDWARPLCFQWITDKQRSKWLTSAGVTIPAVQSEKDYTIGQLSELCEVVGLIGTPEYCVKKLQSLESNCNVQSVFLQPTTTYDMPESTIEMLSDSLKQITG